MSDQKRPRIAPSNDTVHHYGPNYFKLHRFVCSSVVSYPTLLLSIFLNIYFHSLPVPRPGQVLGLVGNNGIGKSTAIKILSGKLKPNLGRYNVLTLPSSIQGSFLPQHAPSIFFYRIHLIGKKFWIILKELSCIVTSPVLLKINLRCSFLIFTHSCNSYNFQCW